MKAVFAFSISLIFTLSGCASIVSKADYPIYVPDRPAGATVTITNKQGTVVCKSKTPTTVVLSAKAGFFSPQAYTFRLEKEGYDTKHLMLSANLDPWYIGNIIFGGLIGLLIVDPLTGAMWKIEQPII